MSTIKRSQQKARRLIGGQMLLDGSDVDEVMDALKAVRSSVLAWQKTIEQHGLAGLLRKGRSGRTAKEARQNNLYKEPQVEAVLRRNLGVEAAIDIVRL